jgi:SAM-dependent methyltransferase
LEIPLSVTACDGQLGGRAEQARATSEYYDRLATWTALARAVGYGGGYGRLTVHRALVDPRARGRATVTRIHDLLAEALPLARLRHVVDLGCGLGGTMIALAAHGTAKFTGLTLSERQAAVGRRAVMRAKLGHRVEILVRSYDEPSEQHFDAAIAIESLSHSSNPATSLRAIAARLTPGAWLAIVDDVPAAAALGTRDLAVFQQGWQLPALWGAAELEAMLRDCNLAVVADRDLTPEVRPRRLSQIGALERVNRLLHRTAPTPGLRRLLDSLHGGLALERLYRHGLMSYRLVIARKRLDA